MTDILSQCVRCKHFRPRTGDEPTCAAFPDGIPDPVLFNEHDHRKPYPGDHGIRFELSERWARLDKTSAARIRSLT